MFHQVCIVGLGLMGGAIGMAARRTRVATRVVGLADKNETIDKAVRLGAIDEGTLDLNAAVYNADLVILAVPVDLIPEIASSVIAAARDGTTITDLGSTKAEVVANVDRIVAESQKRVYFVGSHPLAGSERTGIESCIKVELVGATCILTPTPFTDHEAYRRVDEFWKALQMKVTRLSPEDHDAVLARSSHVPHLVSYALINLQTDQSLELSGPGLRDMARLAGSDVELWTEIVSQNAVQVGKALREFGEEILRMADEIDAMELKHTPACESARERLFRRLADAHQRHQSHQSSRSARLEALKAERVESGQLPLATHDLDNRNDRLRTEDTWVIPKRPFE